MKPHQVNPEVLDSPKCNRRSVCLTPPPLPLRPDENPLTIRRYVGKKRAELVGVVAVGKGSLL